jgi:hypothetical protein
MFSDKIYLHSFRHPKRPYAVCFLFRDGVLFLFQEFIPETSIICIDFSYSAYQSILMYISGNKNNKENALKQLTINFQFRNTAGVGNALISSNKQCT